MNPPPPPPHANNGGGNGSGLPPGKYDIFVIPPHSAGGGFLYLPSLQPHRNSFLAGVACTLLVVATYSVLLPVLREWFAAMVASGGAGVMMLMAGVGVAGWAWGKTQTEGGDPPPGGAGAGTGAGAGAGTGHGANAYANSGPETGGHRHGFSNSTPGQGASTGQQAPPKPPPTWQRSKPASGGDGTARGSWERAREEARKKEEERKKQEEIQKKAEEIAKKKLEEERDRVNLREKEARERKEREERRARDKMNSTPSSSRPGSPKKFQQPTARTEADEDAHSYRPYDKPKTPTHKTAPSSVYSASSYAASQSTARTTPPPSHRGPYSTKDPDKIVIKAVYCFNNAYNNSPLAKLESGKGSVTDGLILRITTEGLFIDDDVRGVPQREWDVKAWTMKLIEVWCPQLQALGAISGSNSRAATAAGRTAFFGLKNSSSKNPSPEETNAFLAKYLPHCRMHCGGSAGSSWDDRSNASYSQSGEFRGFHVLKANFRDQDGKRYVFVLPEQEGWKVAVGLQTLRRGTQVRSLGVAGLPVNETKAILSKMMFI